MIYLCRAGHLVKDKLKAGQECWRCRYNDKRRARRWLDQADKRQRDFENVPVAVDYDNDCAPD